ncbi:hypothetical protein BT69DRAFT_317260 [Atractiella rhizophila]|nr:hypothetical protein BT69DRAFT_317260 [Atractiella rhizophila]
MPPLPNVPDGYDLQISRIGRGDETDFTLEVHLTEGVASDSRGVRVSFWITFEKDKDRKNLPPGEKQRKKFWHWDIQLLPRGIPGAASPATSVSTSADIDFTHLEVELILGKNMRETQARTRVEKFYKGIGGRAHFDRTVRYFALGTFHLPPPPPTPIQEVTDDAPEYHHAFRPPGHEPKRSKSLWNNIWGVRSNTDVSRGLSHIPHPREDPRAWETIGSPAHSDDNSFPKPPLTIFVPTGMKDAHYHQRLKDRQRAADGFWDMARKISVKRRDAGVRRGGKRSASSAQFDEKLGGGVEVQQQSRFSTSSSRRPLTSGQSQYTVHQRSYSTSDLPFYKRYFGGVTQCVFTPFGLDNCRPTGVVIGPGGRTTTTTTSVTTGRSMGREEWYKQDVENVSDLKRTWDNRREWEAQEKERERRMREIEDYEDDEVNTGKFVLVISKYLATPPKPQPITYSSLMRSTTLGRQASLPSNPAPPIIAHQGQFDPAYNRALETKERLRRQEEEAGRAIDEAIEKEKAKLMQLKIAEHDMNQRLKARELDLRRLSGIEAIQKQQMELEQQIQHENQRMDSLERMTSLSRGILGRNSEPTNQPPASKIPKPYHRQDTAPPPERSAYWAANAARTSTNSKPSANRPNGGSIRRPTLNGDPNTMMTKGEADPFVGGFQMERSEQANLGRNGSLARSTSLQRGRSNSFEGYTAPDPDSFDNPFAVSEYETDINEPDGFADSKRFTTMDGRDMTRGTIGRSTSRGKRNTGNFSGFAAGSKGM